MVASESLMTDSTIDRMVALDVSDADAAHVKLATDIVKRYSGLLAELEEFESYLRDRKKENVVRVGSQLKSDLQGELKRIKNLPLEDSKRSTQYLNCTNLPFYEALWSTAKRTSSITSLSCTGVRAVYRNPEQVHRSSDFNGRSTKIGIKGPPPGVDEKHRSREVVSTIDIIALNDYEWIKVSTITERRMLFDLAKSGWVEGDSTDDDDDFESDGILKTAFNLTKLARSVRVRYRNPTVRLVLPRIRLRECHKEVLKVLQKIKDLGVTLDTADDISETPLPLSQVRDRMIPDMFDGLSDTLNVDTTILLAFVSDLSHDSVESKDWHHRMIAYQIKMEREDPMLPSVMWPACGSRKLVCTRKAADRALEIIETIATETERKRMALLLNSGGGVSELSREQRLREFQQLSKYHVPSDWCLPIEIIDIDVEKIKAKLPSVAAEEVSKILIGVNPSVFFYGWESGYTTLTSNRAVSGEIEKTIEKNRVAEEMGPDIWIAPQSRSLVGKEKERRMTIPEDAH